MSTLKEYIMEHLCKGGVQEAQSVSVKFRTGETITVSSDDHPALSRSADEVESVTPKQSAQGG